MTLLPLDLNTVCPTSMQILELPNLKGAKFFRRQRQRCAEFHFKALCEVPKLDLPKCFGSHEDHPWHLFPINIKPKAKI